MLTRWKNRDKDKDKSDKGDHNGKKKRKFGRNEGSFMLS